MSPSSSAGGPGSLCPGPPACRRRHLELGDWAQAGLERLVRLRQRGRNRHLVEDLAALGAMHGAAALEDGRTGDCRDPVHDIHDAVVLREPIPRSVLVHVVEGLRPAVQPHVVGEPPRESTRDVHDAQEPTQGRRLIVAVVARRAGDAHGPQEDPLAVMQGHRAQEPIDHGGDVVPHAIGVVQIPPFDLPPRLSPTRIRPVPRLHVRQALREGARVWDEGRGHVVEAPHI
mmetsp:Transcript_26223/g.73358  ORF Transcript_26223/g.73358 Transcript_26223/m.73358 type:complete len:230 (+) Transcript_26223:128-817(+)